MHNNSTNRVLLKSIKRLLTYKEKILKGKSCHKLSEPV